MIKIKQIIMKNENRVLLNKVEAIKELNKWKDSISLSDENIKSIMFTTNALEIIYMDTPEEEILYPNQCESVGRGKVAGKGQILSIEAQLAEAKNGTSPLEMHANYSRFVCTLIDRSPDVKQNYNKDVIYPMANIPADEVEIIRSKTNSMVMMKILYESGTTIFAKEIDSQCNGPAYTQKLMVGNFRGKTPAQILAENPSAVNDLEKTAEWLKDRISSHAGNKAQYEAIIDGVKLIKNGLLNVESTGTKTFFTIHQSDFKPLMSHTRKDGKTLVYAISINCDISKYIPYSVSIENYYAPVKKAADSTLNVVTQQAIDRVKSTMNLTEKEWLNMVRRMERSLNMFEDIQANNAFRRAQNASYRNRKNRNE